MENLSIESAKKLKGLKIFMANEDHIILENGIVIFLDNEAINHLNDIFEPSED